MNFKTLHSSIHQMNCFASKCKIGLLLIAFVFISAVNSVKAQVTLQVTTACTSDGNNTIDSITTGSPFIFVIDYSISSLTSNGQNVVVTVPLPNHLLVSSGTTAIAYDKSQVVSVTNSGGLITATLKNPINAGTTGQMQISMYYANGSTPYGYNPNIITSITASNATVSPVFDTTNVKALAYNNILLSKSFRNYTNPPRITTYSPVTYNLSYSNNGGSTGDLNLSNAVIVDTLPIGVNYLDATNFSGTTRTVDSISDPGFTIVTWSWGSNTLTGSGSATLTVQYTSPNYTTTAPNNVVSNCINLTGSAPLLSSSGGDSTGTILPIQACASATLGTSSNSITGNGTGIGSNIPGMCPGTVMAGSTATFTAGWTNSGNTLLDSVQVTYNVDKSILVSSVYAEQVKNPVPGSAIPNLLVYEYYQIDNSGNWLAVPGSPFINNASNWSNSHSVTLNPGDFISSVRITVQPNTDAIGAYFSQNLNYQGAILTASQGANGGGTIIQGANDLGTCTVTTTGTQIANCYSLVATANGNPLASNPSCGNSNIVGPAPVFSSLNKGTTNGSSFGPTDTVYYQLSTNQLGIGTAQNVAFTDTLNSVLSYVANSASLSLDGGSTWATITPAITGQTITFPVGNVDSGSHVVVKFGASIAPGTPPSTVPNQALLTSTNSYINDGNPKTNTPTITVVSAAAYSSLLGQNGCDTTHYVYYPVNADATPDGKINYRAVLQNTGNVGGNDITLIDVFPYIGDNRGSQYFANLAAPITFSDPSSTVYYDTVSNPCEPEFKPAINNAGCKTANWSTTPPADITSVKAIKITRSATLAPLDSIVYNWPMILPVGVPANITMYNSYTYQLNRTDNGAQLLPATPNKVGMVTDCISPLGTLGNYAWVDSNANGLQDEGPGAGINGLKVYLYTPGPSGVIGGSDQVLLDSTFTANDFQGQPGYYTFINLNSGNYYVKFPTIPGDVFTAVNQTAQTDGNSDANRTTGYSGLVTIDLTKGGLYKNDSTIDVGYIICTLKATAPKTNITCNNFNDGTISVNVTGNRGPASILWNDGTTVQTKTFLSAGDYSVQVTDSVGCQTPVLYDTIINPPVLPAIVGTSPICIDSTITLTDSIKGGIWSINDTSIATIDSITGVLTAKSANTGIVTYKINNGGYGCGYVDFYPTVIDCSSSGGGGVSSGSTGGLETKSLGEAIVQRVYNQASLGENGPVDYSKMSIVEPVEHSANRLQTYGLQTYGTGSSVTLAQLMPNITSSGYVAYNSTPTDITSITNATQVQSTDFTINQQTKAVAFATVTQNAMYDHTKAVCDRLKGSSLQGVSTISLGGYNFIEYTLKDPNGTLEYATSFTIGSNTGSNSFTIQSTWLNSDYKIANTMYNFQLWAGSKALVMEMIQNVLDNVQSVGPIESAGTATSIPSTYIVSGTRQGANLNLVINNNTSATTGSFLLQDQADEVNTATTSRTIPVTLNANGQTSISIPMSDLYASTVNMNVNGALTDVVFMADGAWSALADPTTASTISSFTVSNDANRVFSADTYPLLRDVQLKGTTPSYISLLKLASGGGTATDLTAYKSLQFTASGGYTLGITLVRDSITNWKNQYTLQVPLASGQKDYTVSLSSFTSAGIATPIHASDITLVQFSVEVGTGKNSSVNTTLSNVNFTKESAAYLNSLSSKEIQIYPNPATGKTFTCSFYSETATELTLKITDLSGRTIATQVVSAAVGQNTVPVRINTNATGVHIITLDGTGVKYNTQKVILAN